ncbi:hypothetical protein F4780DRAFT_758399 [Xylariomycetidae sp. FL0641]|nr:hypothetical protein F4780DRAFT_758399 [Xylariomycetidae sp. FL0641]
MDTLPPVAGDYRLIAASVDEEGWLEEVPADRPTCIVAEGLLMYLSPEQGQSLLNRLVDRFPSGQICADTVGTLAQRLTWMMPIFQGTKVKLGWSTDNGKELLAAHPRLRVKECQDWRQVMGKGWKKAPFFGAWSPLLSLLPSWRAITLIWVLEF